METLTTENLARWTGGIWRNLAANRPVRNFAIDSRRVKEGDCFIALRTDRDDGLRYLDRAKLAGVDFAIVSRFRPEVELPQLVVDDTMAALSRAAAAYRRTWSHPTVAVVGSYGKTTTKNLLVHLLGSAAGTNGANENNEIGVPLNLLRFDPRRRRFGIFEVGINHPGEMGRIGDILRPTDVIFTGLSSKHLEFFSSVDDLFREKLRICDHLAGRLVMGNGLEQRAADLGFRFPSLSVARCAYSGAATFRENTLYYGVDFSDGHGRCRLFYSRRGRMVAEDFELPLPSLGFAMDFALCRCWLLSLAGRATMVPSADISNGCDVVPEVSSDAVADLAPASRPSHLSVGDAEDILYPPAYLPDRDSIARRLKLWLPLPLRGQIFHSRRCFYYVDCYNSDLRALWDSVATFRRLFPTMPRLYVLGSLSELGPASESVHRTIGRLLPLELQDRVVLIGKEMEAAFDRLRRRRFPAECMAWFPDRSSFRLPVMDFRGAVYLKGSRIHRLEELFDFGAMEEIHSSGPFLP